MRQYLPHLFNQLSLVQVTILNLSYANKLVCSEASNKSHRLFCYRAQRYKFSLRIHRLSKLVGFYWLLHKASYVVLKEILSTRTQFPKPLERYTILSFFGPNILVSEADDWKKYRKISAPSFSEVSNFANKGFLLSADMPTLAEQQNGLV